MRAIIFLLVLAPATPVNAAEGDGGGWSLPQRFARLVLRLSGDPSPPASVAAPSSSGARGSVLMIMSSNGQLGDTGEETGTWLQELVEPYHLFLQNGLRVDIASIRGGAAPIDRKSTWGKVGRAFKQDRVLQLKVNQTFSIDEANEDAYDAIFLVGGHGAPWDFPQSESLGRLVSRAWANGKVVGAVCHGALGLPGDVVAGHRVTGFSNEEDEAEQLTEIIPISAENHLIKLGGRYSKKGNFRPNSSWSNRLITGQNPASSTPTAHGVIDAIQRYRPKK